LKKSLGVAPDAEDPSLIAKKIMKLIETSEVPLIVKKEKGKKFDICSYFKENYSSKDI